MNNDVNDRVSVSPRERVLGAALRPAPALAAAVALLAVTSCSADSPEADPGSGGWESTVEYQPASLTEASAVGGVVDATTQLGTTLMAEAAPGENVVLSPASITVALAMLAEGAEGPALEQLDELLGASGEQRTEAFSALDAAVAQYDGDPSVVQEEELPEIPVVHVANQLVLGESVEPAQAFLDALAGSFDAAVVSTDFSSQESKELLDAWVLENTGGLIEESSVQAPDPNIVFVLQNAIAMAAQWQSQFDPNLTAERDFTTSAGGTVAVDTMEQSVDAQYAEFDAGQAVRLPYTEGFAMDVVLPAEGSQVEDVTAEDWLAVDDAFASDDRAQVDLKLPALDFESSLELAQVLEDLGYADVIQGNDLSGIGEAVEIGQVAHQAVLTVDEQGTVAAAVTEIVGVTSAPLHPPETVEMIVDRPFTLRIVHQETGWPLFMATIHDPSA